MLDGVIFVIVSLLENQIDPKPGNFMQLHIKRPPKQGWSALRNAANAVTPHNPATISDAYRSLHSCLEAFPAGFVPCHFQHQDDSTRVQKSASPHTYSVLKTEIGQ